MEPMQLLIIRHADAGDRDPSLWPDDSLRPISPRGRKRHRRVARRLRRRGLIPALLLSSPWLRAFQSAELTAAVSGCPAPVACDALVDTPDLARIAAAIGQPDASAIVALVGHEPWTGELASLLLAGDAHRLTIDFPKSGVLGLEVEEVAAGSAVLEFFLRPKGE
jgi:phosphohistidine phosphatase